MAYRLLRSITNLDEQVHTLTLSVFHQPIFFLVSPGFSGQVLALETIPYKKQARYPKPILLQVIVWILDCFRISWRDLFAAKI